MIQVIFRDGQTSVRVSGLWQWDYGQILEIVGLKLSKAEVHFAENGNCKAIIVPAQISEGGAVQAAIPDTLLESGKDLRAYVYVADALQGMTLRYIYLDVNQRPKPEDYTAPSEKNLLRQIMDTLDKKADDLKLDEEGWLQLLSGENPIGNRVRLTTGGSGGREIELRNNGTAIQWRYTDSNEWTDLASLESLKGEPGETPEFEVRGGHLFVIYKQ